MNSDGLLAIQLTSVWRHYLKGKTMGKGIVSKAWCTHDLLLTAWAMSRSSYLRKLWHIRHTQLDYFLWRVVNFKQPFGGLRQVRFSFRKNLLIAREPYCTTGLTHDRKISRISRFSRKSRNFPARENFLFYSIWLTMSLSLSCVDWYEERHGFTQWTTQYSCFSCYMLQLIALY